MARTRGQRASGMPVARTEVEQPAVARTAFVEGVGSAALVGAAQHLVGGLVGTHLRACRSSDDAAARGTRGAPRTR